ncbi:hypothetical protein ABZ547_19780 [Streptomyces sparsogenes]|uniref:hypothetical protein n=1 Tax=Streptomyces sparsogenes TaxID=67365 RepID=UPI003404E1C3
MNRHPFEPGKLIAGLVVLAVGLLYALDAAGEADLPPSAPLRPLVAGLCLAGLVSALTFGARLRRARRAERGRARGRAAWEEREERQERDEAAG